MEKLSVFQLVTDGIYDNRMEELWYKRGLIHREDYLKKEKAIDGIVNSLPIPINQRLDLLNKIHDLGALIQDEAFKQGFKDGIRFMREI